MRRQASQMRPRTCVTATTSTSKSGQVSGSTRMSSMRCVMKVLCGASPELSDKRTIVPVQTVQCATKVRCSKKSSLFLYAVAATGALALMLRAENACARPHHYYRQTSESFAPVLRGPRRAEEPARALYMGDYEQQQQQGNSRRHLGPERSSDEQFNLDNESRLPNPMMATTHYDGSVAGPQRRDDLDDELDDDDEAEDQSAAASYQNEDNEQPGAAQDGYGENDPEPDAAYEETPNEQEGQADLERFFDDHLGASDRDGMDKENLPTNLVVALAEPAKLAAMVASGDAPLATLVANPTLKPAPSAATHDSIQEPTLVGQPSVQTTRYIQLPDKNKLIITHQVMTRAASKQVPIGKPLKDLDDESSWPSSGESEQQADEPASIYGWERGAPARLPEARKFKQHSSASNSDARIDDDARRAPSVNDIQLTETDDFEPIFVTNSTNKPFKIDALGGYDPEQDFQEAAAEIDGLEGRASHRGRPRRRGANPRTHAAKSRDISFGADSDTETMYEDASETDEVTFGQDDPYQTDLEAEMRQQEFDRLGQFGGANRAQGIASGRRANGPQARDGAERDSDEGAWVNDGVEDMDIPSQSHQNMILEKAAKQADAAAANAGADAVGPTDDVTDSASTANRREDDDELDDDVEDDAAAAAADARGGAARQATQSTIDSRASAGAALPTTTIGDQSAD